jgi:N utilization substance protein A
MPRLYVTRASVDFLKKLFEREVPEIENGVLEIVNAVREPGHRAKVAVRSYDPKVDPVGTCVGIRGSRVQSVTNELNGERIDIIPWHERPEEYVTRAISPADITEIIVGDENEMSLIVAEDKIPSTIGRNGSNIRLASELTGWRLKVSTQEKRRDEDQEHMEKVTAMLMSRLDIDSYAAETLFNEGFESIEVIALTDRSEMLAIEGFTEEFVDKLQQRAKLVMDQDEALVSKRLEEMDPKLSKLEDMDDELLRILAREGILTLEDLGDLANDELMEMTKLRDEGRVNRLIMAARAPILES